MLIQQWLLAIHSKEVLSSQPAYWCTQIWSCSTLMTLHSLCHQDQMLLPPQQASVPVCHNSNIQLSVISSLPTSVEDHSTLPREDAQLWWKVWRDATRTTPLRTQSPHASTTSKVSKDLPVENNEQVVQNINLMCSSNKKTESSPSGLEMRWTQALWRKRGYIRMNVQTTSSQRSRRWNLI